MDNLMQAIHEQIEDLLMGDDTFFRQNNDKQTVAEQVEEQLKDKLYELVQNELNNYKQTIHKGE